MNQSDDANLPEQENLENSACCSTSLNEETSVQPLAVEEQEETESNKKHSKEFEFFIQDLAKDSDPEAKLNKAIQFMEASLAQSGSPHFKSFWEARNICIELFKENIPPSNRAILWTKYSELSKEARRLKEILDEQSAFAVEQIGIAIQALESDIEAIPQQCEHRLSSDQAPLQNILECRSLEKNADFYRKVQCELDLLNSQASRINSMRKELIKTEMRIRHKNKFFQRLSLAGDKVFPRRKELIKEISQSFLDDVDAFIAAYFSQDDLQEHLFYLREEIKTLQGIAKLITLNTHSFTNTRMRLSECWDKIKHLEKEKKKERAQQRVVLKQNVETVVQKIEEFNQSLQTENLSVAEGHKKLDEITTFMRQVELGRDELKFLRDELSKARKPLLDKVQAEEQARQDHESERIRAKKQKVIELKQEIETLVHSAHQQDAEQLVAARDALLEKINSSALIKSEKQELERLLKGLRDLISDKKENAMLSLSDDDRQKIHQLRDLLKQRKERRQEIKTQLEQLRRASGSSGLDFEQAMVYNAQVTAEKERLEKINQGVIEVEKMIAKLEKK